MKTLLTGIILLAILAFAATRLSLRTDKVVDATPGQPQQPIPVVVVEVSPGIFTDKIEALGTTMAKESVAITANVMGRVVNINFDDGERVSQGEILVVLDNDEERALLTAAQANLTTQKTQHKRLEDLIRQKSAAQTTLDEQANTMKRAAVDLEIAQVRLKDRTIRAPFSGQLGIRQVSPGALVSPGDEIVTLDDLNIIKLDFSVPETILSSLQRGLDIEAESVAYPARLFIGKVTTIGTRIDPVTRTVVVRAELPNDEDLLKPGMLLTVNLLSNLSEAIKIPEESLIPVNNKQYVYRVTSQENGDDRVERIEVKIGRRQPGVVEVLAGLSTGDRVVIEGTSRIGSESRVNIANGSDSVQQTTPTNVITKTDNRVTTSPRSTSQTPVTE